MEEYDYLEAQLEGGAPPQAQQLPPPPALSDKRDKDRDSSKRSRSRDVSKDRRSSRRSRSRSPERRRRSRSKSRDRERDRRPDYPSNSSRSGRGGDYSSRPYSSRDRREQHHNNFPRGGGHHAPMHRMERENTPPEVRLQREKEQEQKDLERTVRTVMAMNLNLRATDRDVFNFFSCVGEINDIRLICDKNTKRSKGIAYIEFGTVQSAINAVTLNGQVMMGMPVLVKPSEAEKNLAWEAQEQAKKNQAASMQMLSTIGGAPGMRMNPIKCQILNLHPDIGDEDLKELFAPFGEINYTHVVRDGAGVSTGEAYVQYGDMSMAQNAIKHFNGFELAGKKMSVAVAPLYSSTLPGAVPTPPAAFPGMLPGPPMPGALGYPGMALPPPPGLPGQEAVAGSGAGEVDDLDEAENKSFKLNAQSRQALMSRLATSAGLQAPPSFLGANSAAPAAAPAQFVPAQVMLDQGLLGPASPIPTPCILLRNMFSDADKTDPNWQADVADDVKSEAAKFGEVLHCHVDPNSKGHVYLKFAHQQGAEAASRALNGRYYSGNQIVVSYQFMQPYNSFFNLK